MKAKEREQQEAIARLREWIQPGDTVFTVLRHVSKSGMMRVVDAIAMHEGRPVHLSYNIAKAGAGFSFNPRHEGLTVHGCGMDAGFEVVYNLGRVLWPNGAPCTGDNCRSNDHNNNPRGPRGAGVVHRDGGYTLRHEWL